MSGYMPKRAAVEKLAMRLRRVEPGELITHTEMNDACGFVLKQPRNRSILASARAQLKKDTPAIHFDPEHAVGLVRRRPVDYITALVRSGKHITRHAKDKRREIQTGDLSNLSKEQRYVIAAGCGHLGFVEQSGRDIVKQASAEAPPRQPVTPKISDALASLSRAAKPNESPAS